MRENRLPFGVQRLRQWRERRQQAKIKRLESEINGLKSQLSKAERRNAMSDKLLEDQSPFLWEFERLMSLLADFVKTSNESIKLLTTKDRKALKYHAGPETTKRIFERIGASSEAERDRQANATIYKSILSGDEATRIKNVMPHLESALHVINSFKSKFVRKRKPTQNEIDFWQAIEKHKIQIEDKGKASNKLKALGYNFKKTSVYKYITKSVRDKG